MRDDPFTEGAAHSRDVFTIAQVNEIGDDFSRDKRKEHAVADFQIFTLRQLIELHHATVKNPKLRHAKASVNWQTFERGASDVYFNHQIWWRVLFKVDAFDTFHQCCVRDVKAVIRFSPTLCSFQLKRK